MHTIAAMFGRRVFVSLATGKAPVSDWNSDLFTNTARVAPHAEDLAVTG